MNFKQILLSGHLAARINDAVRGECISEPKGVYNVMKPLVNQHGSVEAFYVIFMDPKNHVITIRQMFKGSIMSCPVYPREIIKVALEVDASALVLVHNHPSGVSDPSPEDFKITKKIMIACTVMGITLQDHVIIGDNGDTHSMAEWGTINNLKTQMEAQL